MLAGRRRLARRSRVHGHDAQIKVRNAPSDDRINFLAGTGFRTSATSQTVCPHGCLSDVGDVSQADSGSVLFGRCRQRVLGGWHEAESANAHRNE
jgi:hypothetical protein